MSSSWLLRRLLQTPSQTWPGKIGRVLQATNGGSHASDGSTVFQLAVISLSSEVRDVELISP